VHRLKLDIPASCFRRKEVAAYIHGISRTVSFLNADRRWGVCSSTHREMFVCICIYGLSSLFVLQCCVAAGSIQL